MSKPLLILHAPGYAPEFDVEAIRIAEKTGADSIGWSEAYREADELAERPEYRTVMGSSRTDTRLVKSPRGDAGDNPISVRKGRRIRRTRARRLTPPGEPQKYAPERWGYSVTYQWDGETFTHIHLHPSPLFVGKGQWVRVMAWGIAEAGRAMRRGEHFALTGDLQTRRAFCKTMLRAAGMRVWNEHVDYVCVSRSLRFVSQRVIHVEGFDHPWMLAGLEQA